MTTESERDRILTRYHRVAIVGISPDTSRPSYRVGKYLLEHGYDVVPVNPQTTDILGRTAYPDLSAIPGGVEIVDIFRRAESVPPIVEEAIIIGAKVVWMQEGIINEEAAAQARAAGLQVVMNH